VQRTRPPHCRVRSCTRVSSSLLPSGTRPLPGPQHGRSTPEPATPGTADAWPTADDAPAPSSPDATMPTQPPESRRSVATIPRNHPVESRPPDPIGWVISSEDWALIRHLHRNGGLSQRAIAKQLGIARDTVASALANDEPPKYQRAPIAAHSSVVGGVSADARHGDRRAGGLDGFDLVVSGTGVCHPPGVSAGRSC
jgi:hypothetical protein